MEDVEVVRPSELIFKNSFVAARIIFLVLKLTSTVEKRLAVG